jgi:hypothetical protein
LKTTDIKKRLYTAPEIECVKLDNEISLALESNPPEGPNQVSLIAPEQFKNDPFKSGMA